MANSPNYTAALRNVVTVDFGLVTESSDKSSIGEFLYFVAWCDERGAELGLHNTPDFDEAVRLAEQAKIDFEATEVLDRTMGKEGSE